MRTPALARPTWWYLAGALPLALVALVGGLLLTGAAAPHPLFDPGPLVRLGLPVVRVLTDAGAALTLGAAALCAFVLARPERRGAGRAAAGAAPSAPAADRAAPGADRAASGADRAASGADRAASGADRAASGADRAAPGTAPAAKGSGAAWTRAARTGAVAAVGWALAQLAHLLLTHASVAGTGLGGPDYGRQLAQFLTEIPLGQTLLWATLLTALVPLAAVAVAGYGTALTTLVLGLAALVPVALTGHAAGAASHELAVSSWWMHAAGVALWVGGLAVLCLAAPAAETALAPVVARYSALALWCFVLVAFSGVANAAVRLTSPAELLTHPYGRLLLVKIVLMALLGLAGWMHRRAVIPALAGADGAAARRRFWRLAGGEVLLMGAVVGVAVALGSSAPPVPQDPVADPTPVFLLSNAPEPPFPTVATYLTQWRLDPLTAAAGVAGVVVYLRWMVRLRRRGDAWSAPRTVAWVAGLLLFAWVTNGGPRVYGSVLFSAHMIEHMLLVMVVPIFLVLGAPITLALRALPRRRDGSRGPREWLLALVQSRWAGFFSHPVVAAVNFAGSLVVFYYTPLFELALTTHVGHVLMIVHFTLAGYLFANALIGIDPGPTRPSYPLRLVLLLGTMAFHAFFGISILSLSTLLAADYFGWLGLSWGVDALADQEKGGAITWGIGEIPTLALAIAVALSWARDDERAARRLDRKADRDDDAELRAYNEMLAARAGQGAGPGSGEERRPG
ncbi:bifunctional copper resistance protein CopD/cytochrome c oxidase assembly protein [Georgenia sp. TF02-10]|uniref:cytochrome c oxidase assembly protein n=1 Tax=Georgenia sp. TF02-10 TaxID=2917725 RepID=UPI001FA7F4C2|nr:cytochrome c oxidase assembly protein [Georgenia sp. TF02-10]UNX54699.1 bifunctional copper resistance protein CopD/cytochrome c oxidase assembly protein [Georgenia sp. TF02-10]